MRRRNFVLALQALLAGCSSLGQSPDGLALGDIEVMNLHEEAHDVSVEVLRDGESVVDETFSLGTEKGTRGTLIQATWADSPAVFEINASLDGGNVQSLTLTEADAANDCTVGNVVVSRRSGELEMYASRAVNDGPDCSEA